MDRLETLNVLLRTFNTTTPDIEGSAIISNDGLIIASQLPNELEEARVGAMAAAMLSLGERSTGEMKRGPLEQAFVQGQDGYALLLRVSDEALVLALTRREAKLGLVFLDIGRLVVKVREVL
jgi:predicted regulator of Ras-like GTPase activity (Roadblock/LC7/MglB family)